MIITYPAKKRKPYFINKPLNKSKYYRHEEAVTIIKKSYRYLALIFTFLLGSHNGYIALWKSGEEKPLKVFPYEVRSLPPADQVLLENGIAIGSQEQLNMLLEDYLS